MHPEEFTNLAEELLSKPRPASVRTAISRAYYSTYHSIDKLLKLIDLALPQNATGHELAYKYLNNAGDNEMAVIAGQLSDLRRIRNQADYNLDNLSVEKPVTAQLQVKIARSIISKLDTCAIQDGRLGDMKQHIIKFLDT